MLDQFSFQQRFPADEVQDQGFGVPVHKIGRAILIQIQDVVHDFLSGFQRHFFCRLMVLIAV